MPKADFPDDRALIEGYLLGDPLALKVVDAWIDAALRRRSLSSDTLDDLRQDVRMRLVKSLRAAQFRGGSSLRTYVHHIAQNAEIDFLHRLHGPPALPTVGEGVAGAAEKDAIAEELVERVLGSLAESDRRLMTLLFRERCSYAEAARRLGKSIGAIKVQVHRCRRKIRRRHGELAAELHGWGRDSPAAIASPRHPQPKPPGRKRKRRGAAARH